MEGSPPAAGCPSASLSVTAGLKIAAPRANAGEANTTARPAVIAAITANRCIRPPGFMAPVMAGRTRAWQVAEFPAGGRLRLRRRQAPGESYQHGPGRGVAQAPRGRPAPDGTGPDDR